MSDAKKRVLIAGANSYVARSFQNLCRDRFDCEAISVRNNAWRDLDLSSYNAVLWCAAMVHQKQRKEERERWFAVNRDLPAAFAKTASAAGVRRFVFLSTMAVYGQDEGVIDPNQAPAPKAGDFYAQSKWEAEQNLRALEDGRFSVAVLRPPIIAGEGAPGNNRRLERLVRLLPFFPDYPNARSVCPIEILCEIIAQIIEAEGAPQTGSGASMYPVVSTAELAREIAARQGRALRFTPAFNPLIRRLIPRSKALRKLFGTLCYADRPCIINL
ncbi:MAG: NAD-dependent epimerase/dehydratase family protein [Clostridiales bacterium]|nr:NAD-dependent epimerase/dehydratase family protein [Clostridiales bacterium]